MGYINDEASGGVNLRAHDSPFSSMQESLDRVPLVVQHKDYDINILSDHR